MSTDGKFYQFQPDVIGEPEPRSRCSRERIAWALVVVALVAVVIGVLVHFVPKDKDNEKTISELRAQIGNSPGTTQGPQGSTVSPTSTASPGKVTEAMLRRIDCVPEAKGKFVTATEDLCDRRGCIYDDTGVKDVPVCYHGNEKGYRVTGYSETPLGFRLTLSAKGKGPFGSDINTAVFDAEMWNENVIRFKFDDPEFSRYKVPLDIEAPLSKSNVTTYDIKITNNETFAFQIIRKSSGKVLWDTGVGGLVLSDQFLQISTKLPSQAVYGFGENTHHRLKHSLDFTSWPMFAGSGYTGKLTDINLYGVHPFYQCVEDGQNAHGVFLLNSNAMDVSFTNLPMLTYRTIGGILDFYMFLGPSSENVIQQYTGLIGRPYMPPYWALGFQLCRYGYRNLQHMKDAVERTKSFNIPHDVQYVDIDYMDSYRGFTVDTTNFQGLPAYFSSLRQAGMRTVVIVDPTIVVNVTGYVPYERLTQVEGAVKWPADYSAPAADRDSTNAMLGYGRTAGKTIFPDFFNNKTRGVWQELIVNHRAEIPFDGLWIDMNEPENFGTNQEKPWNWPESAKPYWSLHCPTNNRYEEPPYRTKAGYVHDTPDRRARLSDKTICMVGRQGDSGEYRHYDIHSLYGWSQAPPTLAGVQKATGERGFVLSRSTYPGSGRYASHWLGDNRSDWPNLKASIIGMLEFNMFGIPHVGADICGYEGNATAELCKRWMQLGAFYPFSRQHNRKQDMDQDPGYFGDEVGTPAREAIETRYWLLPYLYTLFHKAHVYGDTVARPLVHEFPVAQSIDGQFMWGPHLMIVPILEQDASIVNFYKPAATWYDFYTGSNINVDSVNIDKNSKIPLFVRGGAILPMQKPANNTHFSRQNPMKLLIAMSENRTASGDLFWDDGVSADTYETGNYFFAKIMADEHFISLTVQHDHYEMLSLHISEIQIYGAHSGTKRVVYDGQSLTYNLDIDTDKYMPKSVLTITNITIPLNKDFTIYLSHDDSDETRHLDCYPEAQGGVEEVTKATCEARGCIYNKAITIGPICYFNLTNYGYRVVGSKIDTDLGFMYKLEHKGTPNPFSQAGSPDIQNLNFRVEWRGNDVVRIKLEDADNKRYEVPVKLNLATRKATNPRYVVYVTSNDPFSFQVIRSSSGEILWDTGVGGLTFSDQFLQLSTALPSSYIYGFGENVHHSLKHDLAFRTWPMWSRDQPVGWGTNLNHYGVHPFYTCMEDGGHSHGVLLLNSNAQDYSFTPLPMLTYRTIGGVLDFYMFLGPEPENVIQQYTGMVGRPYMPPYWSLGFQLCRYGYNNLTNLQAAAERTINAGIPYDIQYADIDHMDERRDFTIDPIAFAGLNDYFLSLKSRGMHTIIILDPALISNNTGYEPYDRLKDTNSNIKWPPGPDAHIPAHSSTPNGDLLGFVWPKGKAVFPDFFKDSAKTVWIELIRNHHSNLTFDGLWIDMNEPANFGTNEEKPFNWPTDDIPYWSLNCTLKDSTIEHPPYRTMAAYAHDQSSRKAMLSDKTVCLRAVQGNQGEYRHYDVHSLYGWSQTPPTLQGLREATGERGIVISRSTFPGSGSHAGHWLGDNDSKWEDMRLSIIGILEFNLFGIPYIGADICGFFGNTTPELCKRWMQLGAFYTFSRNHNGLGNIEQDPAVFGPDVAKASKVALETRYRLLPYLYTLFHEANTRGSTVIRPLHHVFPYDVTTYRIDKQFMWGAALMISPILYEGQTSLSIYLPKGPWYDFYTGQEMPVQGSYLTMPVDGDSQIPLHLHAGYILPLQAPANNTHFSRQNPFTLMVALENSDNGGRGFRASGELFWDDGVTIDAYMKGMYHYATFRSDHDTLSMTVEYSNESSITSLHIESIVVMGVRTNVKHVYFGKTEHTNITYNAKLKVLTLGGLILPMNKGFSLEWREFQRPSDSDLARFDCYPDIDDRSDEDARPECMRRGCIFSPVPDKPYLPKCYINRTKHGYQVQSKTGDSAQLRKKSSDSLFGSDITSLNVTVYRSSNEMLRVKIFDPAKARYEVPVELNLPGGSYNATEALYDVTIANNNQDFHVQITRKSTNKKIFDSSVGPLIFSDQYIQISSGLASDNFYGLGEHRHFHLKHNMDYRTWPIFTRDAAVNSPDYTNLYGAHPFYMNLEDDQGNAHAVLLLNSNAMEVLLDPQPRVTWRTIGGVLDFYIFLGPEPETVIQQYTQVIGHPVMVPYWSLGFQLCRWGYNSLDNMKAAVDRTKQAEIPHDVQYGDIDYMDERKDFTYDKVAFADFPEYVRELQAGGMHFIVIIDPGIISNETNYAPYDEGVRQDVFVKWPAGKGEQLSRTQENYMLGYVWPKGKVTFPDFLKPNTTRYWTDQIVQFHKTVSFDGLWIDMNEPANFDTNGEKPWNWPDKDKPYWSLKCTLDNNTWDVPPYKPRSVLGELLSEKTLCMIGEQNDGMYKHYNVHSLYGMSEARPTMLGIHKATGKRGLVLSRSTYPTSGRSTTHWLGDNDSRWSNLHDSIIGIIEFNLFGIPYVGADICGFGGYGEMEMCQRWMQLGAFYTFSRNHNAIDKPDQDPAIFGKHVGDSSRQAFETRYSLLPYLYTQFYRVHAQGGTIIRSMMHDFPTDKRTWEVDTQFLWAKALLVAPVLEAGHFQKDVYLPDARWFDFYTGSEYTSRQTLVKVEAPRDHVPLFVRGGYIIPMQDPANNTFFSRQNPMRLLVALDDSGTAIGDIFWDDGDSTDTYETGNYFHANFKADESSVSMTVDHDGYDTSFLHIEQIQIYGAPPGVKRVIFDGAHANFDLDIHEDGQKPRSVLTISDIAIPLHRDFTVFMSHDDSDETRHLDCYPEAQGGVEEVTKATCEARGCIYNKAITIGPVCYFNLTNYGYRVVGSKIDTDLGFMYKLEHKGTPNPFSQAGSPDIQNLNFAVEWRGNDVLRIKFTDADNSSRYEVPTQLNLASSKATNPRYEINVTSHDPFSFQVIRKSSREILWDTGVGGLTFSDQFLQLSTALPSSYIYGFGENVHHSLKHDLAFRTWPMWSRDQPVGWGTNLNHYGVHPFYTCMEKAGHSHGVLLLNSNAQDYSFTPLPMLTYRTIGGVLDFYMFLGPEPENVIQQYTGAVGRPYMPPYWSLGFQLCRYGYNNLTNLQAAAERTINAGIPYDIQYADIDHMDERRDFTIDPIAFAGLNDYFLSLKSRGMHTIIILDPALVSNNTGYEPYDRLRDTNSNIKWPPGPDAHIPADSSTPNRDLLGFVWPKGKAVFPDFFTDSAKTVWKELIRNHHSNLTFDGLWIDMNEPASFGTNEEKPFNWPEDDKPYWSLNCTLEGSTIEHPPYRTKAAYAHDGYGRKAMLSDKTVCLRAVQGNQGEYRHYDVHSLYGWSQTPPTLQGLREATGERGIVISRSTFPGSGSHAGHWLGDNDSKWEEMRLSIIGILEFNLFGIPYIGADICGFFGNTTPELCKRWMQLGAFYTFSRNHNGLGSIEQDPAVLGADVARASKLAMETRYKLLPYLYTLFHNANSKGNTVIRPLHHVFPYDETTYQIDQQFMWGPALLISPILYEGQTTLSMYLPNGPWYDFYTGEEMSVQGGYLSIPVGPDSQIPLHVRSGHILPMQAPANNTHYSRQNPFTLLVALEDSHNGGRGFRASGELFWDDGVTIDAYELGMYHYATFMSGQDTLSMTVEYSNESSITSLHIESIVVMGVRTNVKHVYIEDAEHTNITYSSKLRVLHIAGLQLPLNKDMKLEWREFQRPSASDFAKVDCYPDINDRTDDTAKAECLKRGCIFAPTPNKPYLPKCFLDTNNHGYSVESKTGDSAVLKRKGSGVVFEPDVAKLKVQVQKRSNTLLQVKITDNSQPRYEVPVSLNLPSNNYQAFGSLYEVEMSDNSQDFYVKVKRKGTNTTIFDTSVSPLIFSDQYIQISSGLASDNFYGLGEHRHFHLKHNIDYRTWPIFTRDAAVNSPDYTNLYGAHPFYMNLEDDQGNAHAVLLLNSNAMEVLLDPHPRVTWRTIGGVLDFYIFLGPEPETVIQQYTQVIGHPVMVPYWSLGFQLSRWGYNSLDNMKAAVDRTRAAEIPHDVQYADIDALDERKDFTVGFPGLPDYVKELQAGGMHFIVIIDPGIISNNTNYAPYDDGVNGDVFIKWPEGKGDELSKTKENYMLGYVWPQGKTVFPDFLKLNATQDYWINQIVKYHNTLTFDGLWIDMNEPANFDTNGIKPWNWPDKDKPYWSLKCTLDNNKWDVPPYKPRSVIGKLLSEKTLCMIGEQNDGMYKHYNVHSLYGMSEARPTMLGVHQATGKRGLVLSRSTYPTAGRSTTHWLGDNDSFWRNLHDSIIGIIEFNLFGIPFIGADICGFFAEPSEEMCQRWMQLGAFYTFSRNHNGLGMKEQDPGVFSKHIADSSRQAFEIRYSLLPYLYTQFYRVHTQGGTIIRSMMHEFPSDLRARAIDTQFMWAHGLLVAPVVEMGHVEKDVYFPDARWFDYYSGKEVSERQQLVKVDAPRDFIPLFLRGGSILPTQEPANNTVYSRRNPLGLLVVPDDMGMASGNLFWDDGDSIDTIEKGDYFYCNFSSNKSSLSMTIQKQNTVVGDLQFASAWVYGVPVAPTRVTVTSNGQTLSGSTFLYYSNTQLLKIQSIGAPLKTGFTVTWQ